MFFKHYYQVADDFDRALGQINEKDRNREIVGFQLIQNKFMDIFKSTGTYTNGGWSRGFL